MKIGHLSVDEAQIEAFCEKWGIAELAVFGSVLREDFRAASDVDLLITWKPETSRTLLELVHLKDELSELLGRPVDVAQRRLVEADHNEFRRSAILESARTLYAAA
jgi:predicted nucleotidyltransferase